MSRSLPLALAALALVTGSIALVACDADTGPSQALIVREHGPRVQAVVREDLERGVAGVRAAAAKIAPGFAVEDPVRRRREVRAALRILRQPPRGIEELMLSPIAFVAAVDADGTVIARDVAEEHDRMAGFDAAAAFPMVRRALAEGWSGYALETMPSSPAAQAALADVEGEGGEGAAATPAESAPAAPSTQTVLYAAPSIRDGRIVGAIIAGTPLWRTAQRLGRQLQAENARLVLDGTVLWVYLYRGEELHHHGTPNDLDPLIPDHATRQAGLARSPGGFTGQLLLFGRWYAYGVLPLPRIGDDVGAVIIRSERP